MKSRCKAAVLAISSLAFGPPDITVAQDYPSKPIRIVTSGAGGTSDFTTRLVGQGIAAGFGQPIVVDNQGPGAAQGQLVAKAPADGYTFLVAGGTFWTFPLLQKAPYDPQRDFASVTLIERGVNVLAVHPSLPVKSVKELIALAKARPGELNFSSSGRGGTGHIASEVFRSMAGINMVHVPYKGTGPAVNAAVAGEVQLIINGTNVIAPHSKSGRLRAIAAATLEPSALAPGLPTIHATGVPGYESIGITGMFAPARTPDGIIRRMNEVVVRYINTQDVKDKFFASGVEVIGSTPEQLAAAMRQDMERSGKIIKELSIRVD